MTVNDLWQCFFSINQNKNFQIWNKSGGHSWNPNIPYYSVFIQFFILFFLSSLVHDEVCKLTTGIRSLGADFLCWDNVTSMCCWVHTAPLGLCCFSTQPQWEQLLSQMKRSGCITIYCSLLCPQLPEQRESVGGGGGDPQWTCDTCGLLLLSFKVTNKG